MSKVRCYQCGFWQIIKPAEWTQWGVGIAGFKARVGWCPTLLVYTSAHQYCASSVSDKEPKEAELIMFAYPDA